MTREVTSKHIEGIADLVVVAPIKEGFIDAYENITYQTRLRLVSEALHNVRVSAREHETLTPFSDTTERILTLLNFRIGIHDKDLFQIDRHAKPASLLKLKPRRYLYLAATFDGALEPYMRLIWRPLGIFLDLLFCNCEGYKPAGDTGFPEYFGWVKRSQIESSIFYSTTGLTVKDQIYLRTLERMQRELDPAKADLELCRMTMSDPEAAALADRSGKNELKAHALALEALNILYRLADYYPPDRMDPADRRGYEPDPAPGDAPNYTFAEGRYLLRAARSLLQGWEPGRLPGQLRNLYKEQLQWFESRANLDSQEEAIPDPRFDPSQVQAGILTASGTMDRLVRHGALLLMTVTDPAKARAFIAGLPISYEGDPPPKSGLYLTIAFTAQGLTNLGLYDSKRRRFPKEFREGMERRSGLLGDFRENHPRKWTLPRRNWPRNGQAAAAHPPVEMSEVDFVLQLRYAARPDDLSDDALQAAIDHLAEQAGESGAVLAAYEPMESIFHKPPPGSPASDISGHFELRDGISQPRPVVGLRELDLRGRDDVRLGEIVCGYRNDRGDQAPGKQVMDTLQRDGSFLVIRKLNQNVDRYFEYLDAESKRIAKEYDLPNFTPDDLAARLWGRKPDGTPLVPHGHGGLNDFEYSCDTGGDNCPHASHIRRANPRDSFLGRPAPRIMRRGMSYGAKGSAGPRGIMFMAYCASIAEQFETIQRWINGGNSTGVGAANNDPLVGVLPAKGNAVHRFVVDGKVVRTVVPRDPETGEPLVRLEWGLYLFAPSRNGIKEIGGFTGDVWSDMDAPLERRGKEMIGMLEELPDELQRHEWKRILEDFDAKDPAERNRSPDIWSAIRWYERGSYRLPNGREFAEAIKGRDAPAPPPEGFPEPPSIVLVAARDQVREVLSNSDVFSVEIQGRRIHRTSGDIYVAMQPDDRYWAESAATNQIMYALQEKHGFATGYACAKAVLRAAVDAASGIGRKSFKLELRRDFLTPTLAEMCRAWFGIPDELVMQAGGWSWSEGRRKARCPGDFFAPSRHAFYPEPTKAVETYARCHGRRIKWAGRKFVERYPQGQGIPGKLSAQMAAKIQDPEVLARNIIGMMIGALPPVDGNLRGILYEWLSEKTLWRHQAALLRAAGDKPIDWPIAETALLRPISRAMCKRPAPDLLLRVATRDYQLKSTPPDPVDEPDRLERRAPKDHSFVQVCKGDVVIVSLVSAAQRSLRDPDRPRGQPSFVFGGERTGVWDSSDTHPAGEPVHACPAQKLMMGSMTGILAALLEVGQIRALPSSLIVEISGWKEGSEEPQPAPPA